MLVANAGSASGVILALVKADGTIEPQSDESTFTPVSSIFSSFLSVVDGDDGLKVEVMHFDYDRVAAIRRLREAGDPRWQARERRLMTGVERV